MDGLALVALLIAMVGGLVLKLIGSNLYDRAPALARWIVRRAVWRLHVEDRARYNAEWLAELQLCPGKLDQVFYGLWCWWATFDLNRRPRPISFNAMTSRQSNFHHGFDVATLRRLSSQRTHELVEHFCKVGPTTNKRDTAMLAAKYIVEQNLPVFDSRYSLDRYIKLVTPRIIDDQEGGRSAAMGAVAGLLRGSLNLPFDPGLVPDLQKAAWFVATQDNFLHREYGLLIGGCLVDRFRDDDDLVELFKELAREVMDELQNEAAKDVAERLGSWIPQRWSVPFETRFCTRLRRAVVRFPGPNSEIFACREEAELAVDRLERGLRGASPREIESSQNR